MFKTTTQSQGIYVFPIPKKHLPFFTPWHWKATLQHPKIRRPHASYSFGVCLSRSIHVCFFSPTWGEKWQDSRENVGQYSIHRSYAYQIVVKELVVGNGIPRVNGPELITYFGWNYPRQKNILDRLFCWPFIIGGFHVTPLKKTIGLGQGPNLCRLSRIFFKKDESRTRCQGVSSPGVWFIPQGSGFKK